MKRDNSFVNLAIVYYTDVRQICDQNRLELWHYKSLCSAIYGAKQLSEQISFRI